METKFDNLTELKELRDIAEAKAKEYENAWRKAYDDFVKARNAYEKERDKGKTCNSCRFNIALDFSMDGWHNLCGNDDALCTCCHNRCDQYKPDTYLTSAIKKFYQTERKCEPNLDLEFIKGLQKIGFRVYEEMTEADGKDTARKLVEVLKIIG